MLDVSVFMQAARHRQHNHRSFLDTKMSLTLVAAARPSTYWDNIRCSFSLSLTLVVLLSCVLGRKNIHNTLV